MAPPKLVQPLALLSYTEDLRNRGFEPGRSPVTVEHLPASVDIAGELDVRPGAMVVHLERVLLADGERVLATPREALLIGTNPALPMLLLNHLSNDPDGVPIERGRSLFRGDRFSFVTRLESARRAT